MKRKLGFDRKTGFDKIKEEELPESEQEKTKLSDSEEIGFGLFDTISEEENTIMETESKSLEKRVENLENNEKWVEKRFELRRDRLVRLETIVRAGLGLFLAPIVADMASAGLRSLSRRLR